MIFTFSPYALHTTSVVHLSQNKTWACLGMFAGAMYRYTLVITDMECPHNKGVYCHWKYLEDLTVSMNQHAHVLAANTERTDLWSQL